MVVNGVLDIVYNIVNLIMSPIGAISFHMEISKLQPILQYFKMALYLIPIAELMPIIMAFIMLMSFRIAVSVIKTIWNLLPIL